MNYKILYTILYILIIIGLLLGVIIFYKKLLCFLTEKYKQDKEKKQINFNKCLVDMRNILVEHNIEFFLTCGTLLGYYRENQFIDHDLDIDLGIMCDKYDKDVERYIIDSGLFTYKLGDKEEKHYGNLEDSYEISFRHKSSDVCIDLFLYYPIQDKHDIPKHHVNGDLTRHDYYYQSSFNGKCDDKDEGFCMWGQYLRGFKPIIFNGYSYDIPSNTDEFLRNLYGKDYMTPKKFSYEDGINNKNLYTNIIN